MQTEKEFQQFYRKGTEKARSYYVPFSASQPFAFKNKILNREKSDRFISLNGIWKIKAHKKVDDVDISERITAEIPVPSCVQMHGYDQIQYINCRYPFPFRPPFVPKENPAFHYRKSFNLKKTGEKFYLNFEGVDSCFYLFVNGKSAGFGQISHATNEFDITDFVIDGKNILDVVVLKWCASSYLECQDKFRFTGIFRSVYILRRPEKHITDFKISTEIRGEDGVVTVENLGSIAIDVRLNGENKTVATFGSESFVIKNAKLWTAETPYLYDVVLSANGEKILQRGGIRTSAVENGVYLLAVCPHPTGQAWRRCAPWADEELPGHCRLSCR